MQTCNASSNLALTTMNNKELRDLLDLKLHYLTKNFDHLDWKELRDHHYWWTECPYTGREMPRGKESKIELIEYYVKHGVRKPL